jgi:hypothetical protein
VSEDKDRPESAADLEEARQARALAEALDGRGEARGAEDELAFAARIAAGREPELSESARQRIGDELFGAARQRRPARWPLALAASLLVAVSVSLVARDQLALREARRAEASQTHAAAEALVGALLPGDAASRAEAIARGELP